MPRELGKLYLRIRLLYVYFIYNLVIDRDDPSPSSYRYRRFIAAVNNIIIFITRGRGAGYNVAYRAYRATVSPIDRGAYRAYGVIIAPGGAAAYSAMINGADNIASLGYTKCVKSPMDKIKMIGN